MRLWMAAILMGATALPLAACNRGASDDETAAPKVVETPHRKPGLWKQTTTMAGMSGIPAVSICIDKDADKKLAWWGQQGEARGGCDKNDVNQNPDGSWSFDSVCDLQGGAKTSTSGTATGDFKSAFQVKAVTTTSGAPIPDMNGTHTVTIDYTWEGECPSGMRGGDMRLPDGSLVNLIDIAAAQQQGYAP